MKRIMPLLLLAVVMVLLVSCNSVQSDTDLNSSLTIYLDKVQMNYLSKPITTYKSEHPNVNFTAVEIDGEQEHAKTRTEIMAKKGPDIIVVDGRTFPDAKRTMASGFFADLTPMLESDSSYNENDYYDVIMDSGKYMDMQCVFPICFTFPGIITTQELLDEYGLSFSSKPSFLEITEQAKTFLQQNNSRKLFPDQIDGMRFNYFNVISDICNYDTGEIDLDSADFLQATRNFKEFYKTGDTKYKFDSGTYVNGADVALNMENHFLFYNTNYYNNLLVDFSAISELKVKHTPIYLPIYGFNETINATMVYGIAINNNSKNKQNAYDFLKTVLASHADGADYLGQIVGYSSRKSEWNNMVEYSNNMIITGGIKSSQNEILPADPLDDDFVSAHEKIIEDIGECSMPSGINEMLYEAFLPYFDDTATLESCVQTAKQGLEIYISE